MGGLYLVAVRQINSEWFDRNTFVGDISAFHYENGCGPRVRYRLVGGNRKCIKILRHWVAKNNAGRRCKRWSRSPYIGVMGACPVGRDDGDVIVILRRFIKKLWGGVRSGCRN
jgi:hypothetical protein